MPRGRKAQTQTLTWHPDRMDIFGPVVIKPIIEDNWPMHRAIEALANVEDLMPMTADMRMSNYITRWAASDVVRRRWNPKMTPAYLGQKLDRNTLQLIKAEGLILTKLLNLVSDVFLTSPQGYSHPATWWTICVLEGCSLIQRYSPTAEQPKTKTEGRKLFEGQTASLKARENPFAFPHSRKLFDKAIGLADASTGAKIDRDSFYARSFRPYVESREEMAKFLRKKGAVERRKIKAS